VKWGETVCGYGEEDEGVVEAKYGDEGMRDGGEGSADEDGEDSGGEEEEGTVGEGVDWLVAVEYEMAGLGGGQMRHSRRELSAGFSRGLLRGLRKGRLRGRAWGDEGNAPGWGET